MKLWFKVLLPTVLVCALGAILASPAFAFTGSMWPNYAYPVVVPTPPSPAAAALLAGSSVKAVDGWNQAYLTGTPYQIGFQNGYYGAISGDLYTQMYVDSSQLTWPSGTYGIGTPVKGATAISNECKAGVAMWPLIPVEYQQELQGIADGAAAWYAAQGLTCPDNLWDVVDNNAWSDLSTYTTGGSITAASAASPSIITTLNPNGLVSGMTVTIAGSNAVPSINGAQVVTVIDSTHFSIPVAVTTAGTNGTFTTASPPPIPASPSSAPLALQHGVQALPPVSASVQAAEKSVKSAPAPKLRCSAFIATGPDWTVDGKAITAHNTWSSWSGQIEYNYMFYVHPQYGYDYTYKSCGYSIWSGQDYYANSSGLIMTETTLSDRAKAPGGIPIFVRAAEVAQYASTCAQAEFSADVNNPYTVADTPQQGGDGAGGAYMGFQAGTSRSNGNYCNEWLIGDSTGRIASIILGSLAYDLNTTTNGFYGSCNYGWGPNVLYENSKSTPTPNGSGAVAAGTPPARWNRWLQIAAQYRGKGAISAETGMMFQGDTFDTSAGLNHNPTANCLEGNVSWPLPAAAAHYGTTTAFTGVPPATIDNTTAAATTTKYYAAYAGITPSGTSDSHDYDGTVVTTNMALNGLQAFARWGYAGGDNFFNEPYPQNETDYFLAHGSATVAASPTGATESGNTVTLTLTTAKTPALVAGNTIVVSGVPVAGYNGTFTVLSYDSVAKAITYTDANSSLAASGGGTVNSQVWFDPANNQTAWYLAQMIPIVNSAPGGNAVPWALMGEAVSIDGVPTPSTSGHLDINGWSKDPAALSFTLHGTWTSVMSNIDGAGWVAGTTATVPAPANGSNDGVHTVQYYAVNAGGDHSATQTAKVDIDTQAPVTTATPAPSGWTNGSVTINLAATDANSGVGTDWYQTGTFNDGTHGVLPLDTWAPATWYKVDNGAYVEGTQVTVSGEGHTVTFYSKDNALNSETPQTYNVNIDTTGPVVTVNSPAEGGFYVKGLWAIDATSTDAGSGVNAAARTYTLDGAPATAADVANAEGSHTVGITEYDNAGNSTTVTQDFAAFGSPALMLASPDSGSFLQGTNQTVNFSINGAVSMGSFRVWLKNTVTGAWVRCTPAASAIAPVENQTSYSVPWNVTQPAGSYKLWLYYYGADGSVRATDHSNGTITIGQKPTPILTSPNSGSFLRGTSHLVSWSMSSAASDGTFRVWLKNTATNAWVRVTPTGAPIAAVAGRTAYSVSWFATQPVGTYKLWVYYYAADGSVSATAASSDTITLS